MRIIVVGSVAAGTSVAAKARRGDEQADIVVYERDTDVSYSVCGLPYFLGGEVAEMSALTPRTPAWFAKRYNFPIRTGHEVTAIDAADRRVTVRDLRSGDTFEDTYDALVLATGARPVRPSLPGVEARGVFTLRNPRDAAAIRDHLDAAGVTDAVVVGGGFIGLEVAEQFVRRGLHTTLVDQAPQVMAGLDADMACRVASALAAGGVTVHTSTRVDRIEVDTAGAVCGVRLGDTVVPAQVVVLAVGVRPNVELAVSAGVALGGTGAIAVDDAMRTNVPGIYAVGDAAESFSLVTGRPLWRPLGSTANKMGRIAGDAITGGSLRHRGILGTSIVRVFDTTVASTGLGEAEARAAGFDVAVLHAIKPHRPEYLGGREMVIKAVADRATGRLLGAQIVGGPGVDKRIDVLATAITYRAVVDDLFHLDLAYAPPFATTKDPVLYTGMALANDVSGRAPLITPGELERRRAAGERLQIVDVRSARDYERSHLPGALHIPLGALRARLGELDPQVPTVTYCNKGVSGNAGQNILLGAGFAWVANLSGGNKNYQVWAAAGGSAGEAADRP